MHRRPDPGDAQITRGRRSRPPSTGPATGNLRGLQHVDDRRGTTPLQDRYPTGSASRYWVTRVAPRWRANASGLSASCRSLQAKQADRNGPGRVVVRSHGRYLIDDDGVG